jgi:hypothetical protein
MDDRDRAHSRPMWIPWAMTSVALLVVAMVAFALGARHEVVGADTVMHSHFGFGGIFWVFLIFWFVFGFRRACWWGGPPYYRPWRYRRHYRRMYGDEDDEEREWREWHRREHERTPASPPIDDARGQR